MAWSSEAKTWRGPTKKKATTMLEELPTMENVFSFRQRMTPTSSGEQYKERRQPKDLMSDAALPDQLQLSVEVSLRSPFNLLLPAASAVMLFLAHLRSGLLPQPTSTR
jgi:hypothetical protein